MSARRAPLPLLVNEDKSTRYHRLRRRTGLLGSCAASAALIGLIASGGAVRLREGLQAAAGSLLPAGFDEAATVALVTFVTMALWQVAEFPFAWYQGFVLEHRYGLSRQRAAQWLADQAKAATLGTGLAVIGVSVVYVALRRWPAVWWAISAAVFAVAMVAFVRLAPVLMMPLFYTFRPLDRPVLVERLVRLASRAGTDVIGVFEWVLGGHTRKANAALAGLGQTRRILVSDTMLADYSEDEIEVVLAHELAHHVHRDLWRGMALQLAIVVLGFFLAHLVLQRAVAGASYAGLADPAAVPLLLLVAAGWSFLMQPLVNAQSRAQERAADRYALEATRNPEAFISAMRRLSHQNLAEERPSGLVQLLFYSHPPIRERIEAARTFTRT